MTNLKTSVTMRQPDTFIDSSTISESPYIDKVEGRYVNILGKTVYSWSVEGDKIYE